MEVTPLIEQERSKQKKQTNPFYRTKEWKKKRIEILQRSNWECEWCKKEGKVTTSEHTILEVDHISELNDRPDLALEDSNLRVL